jgi:hypothetical protein
LNKEETERFIAYMERQRQKAKEKDNIIIYEDYEDEDYKDEDYKDEDYEN